MGLVGSGPWTRTPIRPGRRTGKATLATAQAQLAAQDHDRHPDHRLADQTTILRPLLDALGEIGGTDRCWSAYVI